jgi:hypothetical protein
MDNDLIRALRRLQWAANSLSYREFCGALEWEENEYSLHKYHQFAAFGALGAFDSNTLLKAIAAYEKKPGAQMIL